MLYPIKVIIQQSVNMVLQLFFIVILGEKRSLPNADYCGDPFIYLVC